MKYKVLIPNAQDYVFGLKPLDEINADDFGSRDKVLMAWMLSNVLYFWLSIILGNQIEVILQ